MKPFVRLVAVAVLGLAVLVVQPACRRGGPYIWVQQERYIPNLPVELQSYRDRPIYLGDFVNQAANTGTWYYYSPDQVATYETAPELESYMRLCFAKAMGSLGMVVLLDPPVTQDPTLPMLTATIISWDDYAIHFQVTLTKYMQAIFQQEYRIEVQRIETADITVLEDRAYRIMDMVVAGMLADPGFQGAFFQ
jgi:hypothetical protein